MGNPAGTIFSAPFQFKEWRLFHVPMAYGKKKGPPFPNRKPGGDRANSFQDLKNKWVYVIRTFGGKQEWYAEYYVDKNGDIRPVDMSKARGKERDKRPAPGQSCGATIRLPHTINSKRAYYYFFAARVRFPLDGVKQLETRAHEILPPVDLAKPDSLWFDVSKCRYHLMVVDPLTIAVNLNTVFQRERNRLINFTTLNKSMSAAQQTRVKSRQRKLLLARTLKGLLDSDPEDKLDLVDDFGSGKLAGMKAYIKDYDQRLGHFIRQADRAGGAICYWLKGELMQLAETAYRVFEKDDFHAYLKAYARAVERLNECSPGRAYLGGVIQTKNHFVQDFVLRTSAAPEGIFQVGRKSAAAIVTLWTELAAVHIKLKGRTSIKVMVESLTFISKQAFLSVKVTSKSVRIRQETRLVTETLEIVTVRVTPASTPANWAKWSQDSHSIGKSIARLTQGVEIANLALSLKALVDANGKLESVQAILGAVGSLTDTVTAFDILLGLSKKSVARVGMVSAVLDMVGAGFDMAKMASRNDYNAMVGYFIVGAGSAVTAVGCYMVVAGGGTAATGVGFAPGAVLAIVGAIVTAAGWIFAVFASDSDLELFVAHSLWGDDYGSGSASPKWAEGEFRSWKGNLERQIKAMFNILAAFTLDSANYTAVKIYTGMVMPQTKVHIKFDARYNLGITHQPQFEIDCGTKTMKHVGGDAADVTKVSFGKDASGRGYIQVSADTPDTSKYEKAIQHQSCSCEVYLDLLGDGKYKIPSSGKWVKYTIHVLGRGLVRTKVSSKES